MVYLGDLLDTALLKEMIEQGYVRERAHSRYPYRILNYTEAAAFGKVWNAATLQCRGLVVNDDDIVIARPFPKFFNDSEFSVSNALGALDLSAPVEVTDKIDGSLGILMPAPDGGYLIATRGSFASAQAEWATVYFREQFAGFTPLPGYTYLFEIVYPQNRIVVSYGYSDLVLLGAMHIDSGELTAAATLDWPGRKAAQFPYNTLAEALSAPVRDNAEGFVIRYRETGLMVKVKLERYVQLHRLITGLSERSVWQHAASGKSFAELLIDLPDEFHEWVHQVWSRLSAAHAELLAAAHERYSQIRASLPPDPCRKEFALAAQADPLRVYLFLLFDGREDKLREAIWKPLRPAGDTRMIEEDQP